MFCPRLNFRVLSLHSSVSSYNLCKFVESWNYLLHKCNQKHFCTCKVIDPPIDLVRASIQVVKASKDSTKTVGILSFFPLASTTFGSLRQSLYMLASATMSFSAAHSLVYICIIYIQYISHSLLCISLQPNKCVFESLSPSFVFLPLRCLLCLPHYNVRVLSLRRGFVTRACMLVSLAGRISTDNGCARCRQGERTV